MDFINEKDVYEKIVAPSLEKMKREIIPTLAVDLQTVLNEVVNRLQGATITITINLKE